MNNQLEINNNKKYFCRRCLNYSSRTEEAVKKHQVICNNNETCLPVMPKSKIENEIEIKPTIAFKNIQRMLRHPYVILNQS